MQTRSIFFTLSPFQLSAIDCCLSLSSWLSLSSSSSAATRTTSTKLRQNRVRDLTKLNLATSSIKAHLFLKIRSNLKFIKRSSLFQGRFYQIEHRGSTTKDIDHFVPSNIKHAQRETSKARKRVCVWYEEERAKEKERKIGSTSITKSS